MAYGKKVNVNAAGVIGLFDQAIASKLKYPKIRLQTLSKKPVVLSRAGVRSQYTGQVIITDGGLYGENTYYGRIDKGGVYHTTQAVTEEVLELVKALGNDPVKVAQEYGRLTGNCCFCESRLKDERSTSVGYGPKCAKNFGLAWGHPAAKEDWETRVQVEEKQGLTRSDAQAVVDAEDSKDLVDAF